MSKKLTRDEKFLKVWSCPYLFTKNFMSIMDKQGNLVPFHMTKTQKEVVLDNSSHKIIGKSRQQGLSTAILAKSIWVSITKPNTVSVLYSMDETSTRAIFNKLKQLYASIDKNFCPRLLRSNRAEIALSNGSLISCSTLGIKDKSRGNTVSGICHISEMGFISDDIAKRQLLAIEQSCSGELIIESTFNGNNFFAETFFRAQNKQSGYKSFFFSYIEGKELFQNEYKEYLKIFERINGHEFSEDDLTKEERELYKLDGMDLEMLCWRRLKISNSSLETFQQEFPLNPNQAIISTGDSVFDKEKVNANKERLKEDKVKHIPRQNIVDLPSMLLPYYGTSLKLFELPQLGHNYVIGCDISLGIKKDYHALVIVNRTTNRQIGLFRHNAIRPDEVADIIYALGFFYNKSYISIESASGGHSTIDRLYHTLKYYNLHRHRTYDERGHSITKLGFSTNSKTKPMLINTLRERFETNSVQINSVEILNEMETYEAKNGRYSASGGNFDDCVMALAIALESAKSNSNYLM